MFLATATPAFIPVEIENGIIPKKKAKGPAFTPIALGVSKYNRSILV